MTAPWSQRARVDTRASLQHVHEIWAYDASVLPLAPIRLDLVHATLTYDEDQTPFVQFVGSMQVPESQEMLDFLDPRKDIRLYGMIGYIYPDGKRDVQKMFELRLYDRVVRRPQNDMVITAVSDEIVIMQNAATFTASWSPSKLATDAILDLITVGYGPNPPVVITPSNATFVAAGQTETLAPGASIWEKMQEIADRIGYRVWADGQGKFYVQPDTVNAGSAVVTLEVGARGTITASETQMSRDGFANFVIMTFTGGAVPAVGWAEVTGGPYGTSTIGRVAMSVEQKVNAPASQAKANAASAVRRTITRGRRMSLEVSNATYWLRPLDTITAQLSTGHQERHLVSSVVFDIPTGTMNVKTRQPQDVVITTGE